MTWEYGRHRVCTGPSVGQQRVELAGSLQRVELVGATDVRVADPDLRHRGAPASPLDEGFASFPITADVDLLESRPLLGQQALGPMAIGAEGRGVDRDFRHARRGPLWHSL